jgi:hypothetical protein
MELMSRQLVARADKPLITSVKIVRTRLEPSLVTNIELTRYRYASPLRRRVLSLRKRETGGPIQPQSQFRDTTDTCQDLTDLYL